MSKSENRSRRRANNASSMRSLMVRGANGVAPSCWSFGSTSPDRKSTRLNSSHLVISYAVFCLKTRDRKSAGFVEGACGMEPGGVLVDDPVGFFFNDTATTEIYTLSLHDALPI